METEYPACVCVLARFSSYDMRLFGRWLVGFVRACAYTLRKMLSTCKGNRI